MNMNIMSCSSDVLCGTITRMHAHLHSLHQGSQSEVDLIGFKIMEVYFSLTLYRLSQTWSFIPNKYLVVHYQCFS